jgi:hypothetical protein
LSLSLFSLASPPLAAAGKAFSDRINGVRPSWPGLGLNQDVLAEARLDQTAQFDLVIVQGSPTPLEPGDEQRQFAAFRHRNQDGFLGPV